MEPTDGKSRGEDTNKGGGVGGGGGGGGGVRKGELSWWV